MEYCRLDSPTREAMTLLLEEEEEQEVCNPASPMVIRNSSSSRDEREIKEVADDHHQKASRDGEKEEEEAVVSQRESNREEEEEEREMKSEIRVAMEQLCVLKLETSDQEKMKVPTLAFLAASNLLLPFLDKIGPTMAVLRHDIQRNIERLEDLYVTDPLAYSSLAEILKKEVDDGTTRNVESCAKAVLWLTRSMDFGLALLERLDKDKDSNLVEAVDEAYSVTLKPWHGWISSAAYKVALKLIPERKIFISLLLGKGQDHNSLKGDIKDLVSLLQPLLDEIHAILRMFSLDRLKSN